MTPTFLVVGAARSGTTTLRHLLDAHPEIAAPTKETWFVAPQLGRAAGRRAPTPEAYARRFARAWRPGVRATGEVASAYLYGYREAVPGIRRRLGDVRIVAILREPAERAHSHHGYFVREGREHRSFREAVERERRGDLRGRRFGPHYLAMGRYHDQVAAYQDAFSRVRVVLFDDLRADPAGLAADLYAFLGVDPGFVPPPIGPLNASGVPRSRLLQRAVFRPTPARAAARRALGRALGDTRAARLVEAARRRGLRREPADPELAGRLRAWFRDDVERLASRIGRDLSHWQA